MAEQPSEWSLDDLFPSDEEDELFAGKPEKTRVGYAFNDYEPKKYAWFKMVAMKMHRRWHEFRHVFHAYALPRSEWNFGVGIQVNIDREYQRYDDSEYKFLMGITFHVLCFYLHISIERPSDYHNRRIETELHATKVYWHGQWILCPSCADKIPEQYRGQYLITTEMNAVMPEKGFKCYICEHISGW